MKTEALNYILSIIAKSGDAIGDIMSLEACLLKHEAVRDLELEEQLEISGEVMEVIRALIGFNGSMEKKMEAALNILSRCVVTEGTLCDDGSPPIMNVISLNLGSDVTFDASAVPTTFKTKAKPQTLYIGTPTRPDYIFDGWEAEVADTAGRSARDGSEEIPEECAEDDKPCVTIPAYAHGTITLTAKWIEKVSGRYNYAPEYAAEESAPIENYAANEPTAEDETAEQYTEEPRYEGDEPEYAPVEEYGPVEAPEEESSYESVLDGYAEARDAAVTARQIPYEAYTQESPAVQDEAERAVPPRPLTSAELAGIRRMRETL